jgi:hypothetical protein
LETLLVFRCHGKDPVPKEKARVMDEAMNWLRNNEVKPGDVDVDVLSSTYDDFRRSDADQHVCC